MPSHVSVATAWLRVPEDPPGNLPPVDVFEVRGVKDRVAFEERDGDGQLFIDPGSLEDLEVRR